MPHDRTLQNRTSVRHLVSLLYFGKNANLTKLRIKQQEHTLRCQLNCAARDLRDRAAVLCMLTYPLVLLSKPVSPKFLSKSAKILKKTYQIQILPKSSQLILACPSPKPGRSSGRAVRYNLFWLRGGFAAAQSKKDFHCHPSRNAEKLRKFWEKSKSLRNIKIFSRKTKTTFRKSLTQRRRCKSQKILKAVKGG